MAALIDAIEATEPALQHGMQPTSTGDVVEDSGRAPEEEKRKEAATDAAAAAAAVASAADTATATDDDGDGNDKPSSRHQPPPKPSCSSCGAESKYQCPRCGQRSCSAPCVGKHKEATGCTGKRDRAAFVPVSAMTDATLASDIGLLEEVERAAAAAQRGAALPPPLAEAVAKAAKAGGAGGAKNPSSRFRGGAHRGDQPSPSLPQHLQQLVAEAGRRGVRLRLAPPGFDARRRNGTRYEGKQKKMQWHLEWRFYSSCSSSSTDFVTREDRRIREDAPLGPFLRRHLEAKKEEEEEEGTTSAAMATATAETTAISLPRSFAVAEKGASSPLPFRALLRLDGRPANNPGWLDFSLSDHFDEKVTLAELLRGRTVDEFPVVALFAGSPSSSTLMLPPGEVVPFARAAPAIVTLS